MINHLNLKYKPFRNGLHFFDRIGTPKDDRLSPPSNTVGQATAVKVVGIIFSRSELGGSKKRSMNSTVRFQPSFERFISKPDQRLSSVLHKMNFTFS